MNYFLYHEDAIYKAALEKYYKKHMQQKLVMTFHGQAKADDVVLCEPEDLTEFPNHQCIFLGRKNLMTNNEINKYQDMHVFFDLISQRESHVHKNLEPQVYILANSFGGSGSTSLSMHLAKVLSENQQVFYMSLDVLSTYEKSWPQGGVLGFSEVIYKLKTQMPLEWSPAHNLEFFSSCDYLEDMLTFNCKMLKDLIDQLKAMNYQHIVVDIGQRYEFLQLENFKSYVVLKANDDHLSTIGLMKRLHEPHAYLINKKKAEDGMTDDKVQGIKPYYFVPFDAHMKKGDQVWQSQEISNMWRRILSLKS